MCFAAQLGIPGKVKFCKLILQNPQAPRHTKRNLRQFIRQIRRVKRAQKLENLTAQMHDITARQECQDRLSLDQDSASEDMEGNVLDGDRWVDLDDLPLTKKMRKRKRLTEEMQPGEEESDSE